MAFVLFEDEKHALIIDPQKMLTNGIFSDQQKDETIKVFSKTCKERRDRIEMQNIEQEKREREKGLYNRRNNASE